MSGRAVLLVEDEPADVLFMRRAWKQVGLEAPLAVVDDGEKAMAYLTGSGPYADRAKYPFPSLVLLDLKIPLLSGLEVLDRIRKDPGLNQLPVTVLTSSEEPGDVSRARALGVTDYIVKPTAYTKLIDIVRGLAGRL
jgi:CheY-like chemotaxis protein